MRRDELLADLRKAVQDFEDVLAQDCENLQRRQQNPGARTELKSFQKFLLSAATPGAIQTMIKTAAGLKLLDLNEGEFGSVRFNY